MTTTSTATATATNGRYTITVEGQTIEFSSKPAYTFVVIAKIVGVADWQVFAKSNKRNADQKVITRLQRNFPSSHSEVLVVPVEHLG